MIAPRGFGLEGFAVPQPGSAESIQLRAADLQTFEGGHAVHLAVVEQIQDFGDTLRTDPMS